MKNKIIDQSISEEAIGILGVASDLRTFIRGLTLNQAIKNASLHKMSINNVELVFNKTLQLIRRNYDYRYENPNDLRIAVLLWLLSHHDIKMADILCEELINNLAFWWARKIAKLIVERSNELGGAYTSSKIDVPSHELTISITNHNNSDENICVYRLLNDIKYLESVKFLESESNVVNLRTVLKASHDYSYFGGSSKNKEYILDSSNASSQIGKLKEYV